MWEERARELMDLSRDLDEDREGLRMRVLVEAGRAAQASGNADDFLVVREGEEVNQAWWEAAEMLVENPKLRSRLRNSEIRASVEFYANKLRGREDPPLRPLPNKLRGREE